MRDKYGNPVDTTGPFGSVAEMKDANAEAGYHFFSEDTMRFFDSRIESPPLYGRFLITSEKPPHGPRAFSIIAVKDDGATQRVGEFQQFGTWDEARNWLASEIKRDNP